MHSFWHIWSVLDICVVFLGVSKPLTFPFWLMSSKPCREPHKGSYLGATRSVIALGSSVLALFVYNIISHIFLYINIKYIYIYTLSLLGCA